MNAVGRAISGKTRTRGHRPWVKSVTPAGRAMITAKKHPMATTARPSEMYARMRSTRRIGTFAPEVGVLIRFSLALGMRAVGWGSGSLDLCSVVPVVAGAQPS